MTTRALASWWLTALLAAVLTAGCSFADAKVGAPQDACDLGDAGHVQGTPGASGYSRVSEASTSAAPVCVSTGNACDDCEGARSSECWGTFSATGTVEQARVACQRAWCQTECLGP